MQFLEVEQIIKINKEVIHLSGGLHGLRDKNLLESAIMNPRNLLYYKNSKLFELASSYAISIVKNHPFIDGNKRSGFGAMDLFLELNGTRLNFPIDETVEIFVKIAIGEIKIKELEEWLVSLMTHTSGAGVV